MINVEAIIYILSTSIISFVINLLILNYYRSVISEELNKTNHNLGLIEFNLGNTNRVLSSYQKDNEKLSNENAAIREKIEDLESKNKERVNGLQKEIDFLSGKAGKRI